MLSPLGRFIFMQDLNSYSKTAFFLIANESYFGNCVWGRGKSVMLEPGRAAECVGKNTG